MSFHSYESDKSNSQSWPSYEWSNNPESSLDNETHHEYNGERDSDSDIASSSSSSTEARPTLNAFKQMSSKMLVHTISSSHDVSEMSWELALYTTLKSNTLISDTPAILIQELLDAYRYVMDSHGLTKLDDQEIINTLRQIKFTDHSYLLNATNNEDTIIRYQQYMRSLQSVIYLRKYYGTDYNMSMLIKLKTRHINWNKHGLIVFTCVLDAICGGLSILPLGSPVDWIYMARANAVILLLNMGYLLLPLIGVARFVPDTIIAKGFTPEYKEYYHKVFGIKIIAAAFWHSLAHFLHIESVLRDCVNGCLRKPLRIVKSAKTPIIISWGFFLSQLPYWTGIILIVAMFAIPIFIILSKYDLIRYSTNMVAHKYISTIVFAFTIVHGVSHLIGFNWSYVLILPLLILYLWHKRRELILQPLYVTRWVNTDKYIKLYIRDNVSLNKILHSFGTVSIYINHPNVSKLEWHPFTLSRGVDTSDGVLVIKKIGKWTNHLSTLITTRSGFNGYVNIGSYTPSKFRFHRIYHTRYFFCSGIGIMAFISMISDMRRRPVNESLRTVLIWSIPDMNILRDFSDDLIDIQRDILNVKIYIYYSNSSRRSSMPIPYEIKTRFLYLQAIIFGHSSLDIVSNVKGCITCELNRVDCYEILSRAAISAESRGMAHEPIGVFICGSKMYSDYIQRNVNLINRNTMNVPFRVWSESV
jgi:Ferric reductase NAD binding domain/FAD-binding domain